MYVAHGVVALEVAGQMIAVAQVKDGYIWTTEYTNGKEADVLSALKRATQQAVRESRFGGLEGVVKCLTLLLT